MAQKFLLIAYSLILILSNSVSSMAVLSQPGHFPLFIARENEQGVVIERLLIEEGSTKVIDDPSVITIILPVGEGTAGSIVKRSDREESIIVNNRNNTLEIVFRSGDGNEKVYPAAASLEELNSYQIRMNITRGDGYSKVYKVINYDQIIEDEGPVIDMFKGMIPLNDDDYSFTIETKKIKSHQPITGKIAFEIVDEWIVVLATLPNHQTGRFIVDTGASGGLVVQKDFLPENIRISPIKAVAYNGDQVTETDGQMQGAAGTVKDDIFLGRASLSHIILGDMTLENLEVNVLREFPDFLKKNEIKGIIGLDVLQLAKIIKIQDINKGTGLIEFSNQGNSNTTEASYAVDFQRASNLLFIKGSIQDHPIEFLLDIGARNSLMSNDFIIKNKINYSVLDTHTTIGGMEGNQVQAIEGSIPGILLEAQHIEPLTFKISDQLSITHSIGLHDRSAILGMNFFKKFTAMEIDFVENTLSLY